MSRPCHCRMLQHKPGIQGFAPVGNSSNGQIHIKIPLDCLEALRLADCDGLGMESAALRMGISRHTFGRLLKKARSLLARAICGGYAISFADGENFLANPITNGEIRMSETVLVAVPSDAPGGLDAKPSAHFGHCAAYTIARVADGKIEDVRVLENKGHEHGACVQPVQDLARDGVKVLLAGGMGMRPLNAMREAGIQPYFSTGHATVQEALEAFAAGKLQAFGEDQLCRGNCGHHH